MLPPILIETFPPHPDALLTRCAEFVTDDMLEEISRADYGMDADEHLLALLPIRDEARIPAPMQWKPKEVLALVRWSQPEDPAWKPGSTGERGHMMRAFCCAALLRAGVEPENEGCFLGENETLIQLIESALFLGRGVPEAAGSFLAWRLPQQRRDDEEWPFFAFGLVALALLLKKSSLATEDIERLTSFVEQAEADVGNPLGVWMTDMSFRTHFDQRHSAWSALAGRVRLCTPGSERLVALTRRIEVE